MIIDADAHLAPSDLFDKLGNNDFVSLYKKENEFAFVSQIDAYEWSREYRYKVDRQLLNFYGPSCGLSYRLPLDQAADVMRCYNNYMIELSKIWNNFDVNLWLAMQDPKACMQELDRLSTENFFGVHVGEQIPWGYLPQCDEIFAWLEENGVPVYLHFAGRDDKPVSWFENLPKIYHDFKQTLFDPEIDNVQLAMLSMIDQTLPKFPNLKIVIAETGIHWLAQFCQEIQNHGLENPYHVLKNNFWFTCEPEQKTFLRDAEFIGWDRLLFATDAPHNDIGGKNADHDVEIVKNFVRQQIISDSDYRNFTEQNYLKVKERSK